MIIPSEVYSSNIVNIEGEFVAIFLIVATIVSVLLSYTRYWNKYNSAAIDACLYPMLIIFAATVIFKAVLLA